MQVCLCETVSLAERAVVEQEVVWWKVCTTHKGWWSGGDSYLTTLRDNAIIADIRGLLAQLVRAQR